MIIYQRHLENVNWQEMKATLTQDNFDNSRSPEQLQASFANSYRTCIAYAGNQIIGTARVLSDGICNAYIVDVWTFTPYRRQGIASQMMQTLLNELPGQHICLFTDEALEFYQKLGFKKGETCMEQVIGKWLENNG
ncbi:GNAT family N-acetyltransferase [Nostoc sp. CHAB 5844]|nr:GNAT family N-acetyltransferase [Nostoc sp. CHAB 5844]